MDTRTLKITTSELSRLLELLRSVNRSEWKRNPHLMSLRNKLENASDTTMVTTDDHVVTLNKYVRLRDSRTKAEIHCRIVYPDKANLVEGRISVLTPLGAELLGRSVGEQVEYQGSNGLRSCQIMGVSDCSEEEMKQQNEWIQNAQKILQDTEITIIRQEAEVEFPARQDITDPERST